MLGQSKQINIRAGTPAGAAFGAPWNAVDDIYRFGPFELDAQRLVLRRGGEALAVEHKPLEVLAELVRNAGDLVSKNDLMESVWAGRVVTESVISSCVKKLRAALGDDSQTLILTVHGYGYRFTGALLQAQPAGSAAPAGEPARSPGGPKAGDCPPLRPHWRLKHPFDDRGGIWLAEHDKTLEKRVFKFALDAATVSALKRELTIHRLLQRSLGDRADLARLLDYNLEAQPYFLELEYCSHGSLVDWLEGQGGAAKVPLRTRLDLMAQAAEALAAAHAVGVLHLDIKPSNLLIWTAQDGSPRIRWTDFGSGRLTEPGRLAELNITRMGMTRTLSAAETTTLLYCPPEVIGGQAPTVLADIYALGVMLFQVVLGDLRKPMAPGWELDIADEILRGDIAAAAAGNPASRLSSAAELAQRLRNLEPRRAELALQRQAQQRAAELQERVDRSRARRPWLMAAGVALSAGLVLSLWYYRQALQARDEARSQAAIAQAVVGFLDQDILSAGSPFSVNGNAAGGLTVREAVDRAAAKLDGRFPGQPEVEASIRAAIGQVYVEDGDYDAAEKQVRKAVQLGRSSAHGVDFATVRAEYGLVFALTVEQKFAQARALLDEANATLAASRKVDLATALRRDVINGNYYFALQEFGLAAPYFDKALAEALQQDAGDVSQIAIRRTSLAWSYSALGRFDEAQKLFADALDEVRHAEKDGGTLTGTVEERYGIGLFLAARDAEAGNMLDAAYKDLHAAIGDDGLTAEALTFAGWLKLKQGHAGEARAALRSAYAMEVASAGAEHRMSLRARACLGLAEIADGERQAGMQDLAQAVAAYDRVLGPTVPEGELFKFLLVREQLAGGADSAGAQAQLAQLDPVRIALAAPGEDWKARLALLKSEADVAAGRH